MLEFYTIVKDIVLPIFVLVGLGAFLEKRFKLDIATVSKLNFYVFMPALIFKALTESQLQFDKLALVAVFQVMLILVLFALNFGVARSLRLSPSLSSAFLMAAVFCNSGNYGLPLVQLAFEDSSTASSYQAITIMVQNLATFTLGLVIIGHGKAKISDSLRQTFRLPFVYVIAAALLLKQFDVPIMKWWLWNPIRYAGDGLVAVALVTLGIQIAKTPRVRHVKALGVANFMRLAVAPLAAFALVKLFIYLGVPGLEGMLGHLLVIAAAGPSAVNTVLIGLEFKNEPEFAASTVVYSTLFSGATVALTIFLVRHFM